MVPRILKRDAGATYRPGGGRMVTTAACERNAKPVFYKARDPHASPMHQLFSMYFDEFERVYEERYQKRYGFWRPVIRDAVDAFLACGDVEEGFARVRCPDCAYEFFVALSCGGRCICASCHQKRTLLTGLHISENVCEPVAHRQFVWTLPKRFRRFFLLNRDLLRKLPLLAWGCLLEVYRAVLGRDDVRPGMIASIQTFGNLSHFNPHLHSLATDGAFTSDGTFIPLPEEVDTAPFLLLWEQKVFDLLVTEGRITAEVVTQMRNWRFTGFSVDKSVRIAAGDKAGLERLSQYMVRCPFSLDRIVSVNEQGQVVYRAEKPAPVKYPLFGDERLTAGTRRNFEVFDPLDFIAEITQHVPDKGAHLIRYYGWYSNKTKGLLAQQQVEADLGLLDRGDEDEDAWRPSRKAARLRWAALIRRVYESDPLSCPQCGAQMDVISLITAEQQPSVVRKIVDHCRLARDPPTTASEPTRDDLEAEFEELKVVPIDEFLASL